MTKKPPPLPKRRGSSTSPAAPPRTREPGAVFSALAGSDRLRTVPVEAIDPSPFQARRDFDADGLAALAASIEANGLLSPPIVRPTDAGRYELIGGERRLRAVKLLGRDELEVLLEQDVDDAAAAVLSLLENTARADLNAIEEARAYAALIEDLGLRHEDVAKSAGRSRSTVTNHLRLLELPDEALALISDGALSFAHGRALLTAQDHGVRRQLAKQASHEGWSSRQLESRARAANETANRPRAKKVLDVQRASFAKELAEKVTAGSGLDCKVQAGKRGYTFQFSATSTEEATMLGEALATFRANAAGASA